MPAIDSAALIIARYLKNNNFNASYEAFIVEAGLPNDAGNATSGDLTLETLLEEKKTFDIAVRFEKLGVEDDINRWTQPALSTANIITSLPTSSNVLSTGAQSLAVDDHGSQARALLASTADRRLHLIDAHTQACRDSLSSLHDAPILSHATFRQRLLLTTSMSGSLVLSDTTGKIIDKRKDHNKFVVKVAVSSDDAGDIVATAGWDSQILIYRPKVGEQLRLGEPAASIPLSTKPEAMIFAQHPESKEPILLVTRTDSNFIYYYSLEQPPRLLGKQNLAPHSNAWVAFTPSAIELCPTDPSVVAIGTSSIPHMKLLIVRLMFPAWEQRSEPNRIDDVPSTGDEPVNPDHATQASQARAAIALADREAAAIQIHANTMAPQTAYSTPAVAWRPDGSGIWVNGDDGAIRGIEASTGKIVSTLLGHEPGSKVRCLWAGDIGVDGSKEEVLVSGGFDQRLIVWKVL